MLHEPQAQKPRARGSPGARGAPVCTWSFAAADRATFEALGRGLLLRVTLRAAACADLTRSAGDPARRQASRVRARAGDFVVPGMASMPPAERHLVLTAAVKSIAWSFKRRRLVPVLPSLSWTGGGGKAVLYGDDKYKEADVQYAS